MSFEELNRQAQTFLKDLFSQLAEHKIEIKEHWMIDHLCYRVDSLAFYEDQKVVFSKFGKMMIESEVNGRLIATFKLNQPIEFGGRKMYLIELPAPKKGKITANGFEHIEVVIDVPFAEIIANNDQCQFDQSGLSKLFNKELEIPLRNCAIKFHHLSLESVVCFEKNKDVFDSVQKLKILEILKPFDPQIVGTFPLGIATPNSDVDILVSAPNLSEVSVVLKMHYSSYSDFSIKYENIEQVPSIVARFTSQSVKFEIFGQAKPTLLQNGYRHFQIEEKLLAFGGDYLREKIRNLRTQGLKTEPAFAQLLKLNGNPYDELLKLSQKSERELTEIVKAL